MEQTEIGRQALAMARSWNLHEAKKDLQAKQDELATLAITITTAHLEWSEVINQAQKELWAKVKGERDEAIEKVTRLQALYDEVKA